MFRRQQANSADPGLTSKVEGPLTGSQLPINSTILEHAIRARDLSFTGALRIVSHGDSSLGDLYFFEGRIYAAAIDGFEPGVLARLMSSELITLGDSAEILELEARLNSLSVAVVESGLVSVDQLAAVHQEFVVASVGSLLLLHQAEVVPDSGRITSSVCTLPLDLNQILGMIEVRYRRMAQDAAALSHETPQEHVSVACDHPGSVVLDRNEVLSAAQVSRTDSAIPEILAMLNGADGVRSLDELAGHCGFTRAEAVHIARSLASQGLVTVVSCSNDDDHSAEVRGKHQLMVPEECSSRDWSLASIAFPRVSGDAEISELGRRASISYTPSHDLEPIVLDAWTDQSQSPFTPQ